MSLLLGPADASAASAENGKKLFIKGCGACHTLAAARADGGVGPNLDTLRPTFAQTQAQVVQGGGAMPSFAKTLTAAQIREVAAFVASRAGKGQ